jgi:flagellar export protein FliJ
LHDLKSRLQRLERLSDLRRTHVMVAEGRVAEARRQVALLEENAEAIRQKIREARSNMVCTVRISGEELQAVEKFVQVLQRQAAQIEADQIAANAALDLRRLEWTEALREQKIVDRVQEKRRREWKRQAGTGIEKEADRDSVMRHHCRTRRSD